ncbi:MAG: hypothetical protein JNJ58_05150 [Chitinophagaceae bacterium]|nr:hypothetical protein [Chitinophagaceae bacterium]
MPSNSFENIYRHSNPTLVYSYDSLSQMHNYSKNWDFDQDGINDELYFVGTGGSHLYYFLKVVLSTDNKAREYQWIQSDLPIFITPDTLNPEMPIGSFSVMPLSKPLTPTIMLQLDELTFDLNKKEWTKLNITTPYVSIRFENGKAIYSNPAMDHQK